MRHQGKFGERTTAMQHEEVNVIVRIGTLGKHGPYQSAASYPLCLQLVACETSCTRGAVPPRRGCRPVQYSLTSHPRGVATYALAAPRYSYNFSSHIQET